MLFTKVGVLFIIILQLNISLSAPAVRNTIGTQWNKIPSQISQPLAEFHQLLSAISKNFFGITRHPVFMDTHFIAAAQQVKIVCHTSEGDIELPFITEKGLAGNSLKGGSWVNWTFRINHGISEEMDEHRLSGLERYIAFWLGSEGMNQDDVFHFTIFERPIKTSFQWIPNLLIDNMNEEWNPGHQLIWEQRRINVKLVEKE